MLHVNYTSSKNIYIKKSPQNINTHNYKTECAIHAEVDGSQNGTNSSILPISIHFAM